MFRSLGARFRSSFSGSAGRRSLSSSNTRHETRYPAKFVKAAAIGATLCAGSIIGHRYLSVASSDAHVSTQPQDKARGDDKQALQSQMGAISQVEELRDTDPLVLEQTRQLLDQETKALERAVKEAHPIDAAKAEEEGTRACSLPTTIIQADIEHIEDARQEALRQEVHTKQLQEEARQLEHAIRDDEEHFTHLFGSSCGPQFRVMYGCVKGRDFDTPVCRENFASISQCVKAHPQEFPESVLAEQ